MQKKRLIEKDPQLNKDDLIVITGAGGFIGGNLALYLPGRVSPASGPWTRSRFMNGISRCRVWNRFVSMSARRKTASVFAKAPSRFTNSPPTWAGMGFIERFRVECLRSILINTHMIEAAYRAGVRRYFYSSSACAYNIAAAAGSRTSAH